MMLTCLQRLFVVTPAMVVVTSALGLDTTQQPLSPNLDQVPFPGYVQT